MGKSDNINFKIVIENSGDQNKDECVYDMRPTVNLSLGMVYNFFVYLNFALLIGAKILVDEGKCGDKILKWKNYTLEQKNHRMIRKNIDQIKLFLSQYSYSPYVCDELTISRMSSIFQKYFELNSIQNDQKEGKRILILYRDVESEISCMPYLKAIEECNSERTYTEIRILNQDFELVSEVKKSINLPVFCPGEISLGGVLEEILNAEGYIGQVSLFSAIVQIVKPQIEWSYWKVLHGASEKEKIKWYTRSLNLLLHRWEQTTPEYAQFITTRKCKDYHRCFAVFMNRLTQIYKQGGSIAELLKEQGIKTVGIYGAGTVGCFVYQDLTRDETIKIEYIVDKGSVFWKKEKVWKLQDIGEERLNRADILILTPLFLDYEDTYMDLFQMGVVVPVFTIESIIYD